MMTVMMKITILQAVMSLYGGGQMTGVAVDSGQVSLNFNSIFNSDGDMAFSEIFDANLRCLNFNISRTQLTLCQRTRVTQYR